MFQNTGFFDSKCNRSPQLCLDMKHGILGFQSWVWADMKQGLTRLEQYDS